MLFLNLHGSFTWVTLEVFKGPIVCAGLVKKLKTLGNGTIGAFTQN